MRRTDRRIVLGLHRSRHERQLLEQALNIGVRELDTAYNYRGFTSHKRLAYIADDLLPEFAVSTKIGFFPSGARAEHSLDPSRLRNAVEKSVVDLEIRPRVVFLHNPERTLAALAPNDAHNRFVAACTILADSVATGLCDSWGVSCWDPRPVLQQCDTAKTSSCQHPMR